MKTHIHLLSTLVAVALLTACGGGGENVSSPAAQSASVSAPLYAPPVTAEPAMLSKVPATSYAAQSEEMAVFTQLNDIRQRGGFGSLEQDAALDKAARNHTNYFINNWYSSASGWSNEMVLIDPATGSLNAHIERPTGLGFSGITVMDRVRAAGGNFSGVSEVISPAENCLDSLLNTVFHRDGLLITDFRAMGMAYLRTPDKKSVACTLNLGYAGLPTIKPDNWIGVYPGVGQRDTPIEMGGEAPDPAPDLTKRGAPLSVYFETDIATIQSFSLTQQGSAQPVPARRLTKSEFPRYIRGNIAHLLPIAPLEFARTYTAHISATLANGKVVSKTWSYSTLALQSLSLQTNATGNTLKAGSPITVTVNGGYGASAIYQYSTYQYFATNTNAQFADVTENSPRSITLTRNATPCRFSQMINCGVVVVGQDSLGRSTSQTFIIQGTQ